MSKSILIIDTPKNCAECKLVDYWKRVQEYHCRYLENRYLRKYDEKPVDCPLKPIPEKYKYDVEKFPTVDYENGITVGHNLNEGWNDCIDELLKGEEENK